ncbi:MAG: hypothetical protein LBQ54_10880 [Planctomycetaceae bacterium]|jgi:hypothetical protein|nr:hypothetical protein [Planctomycetaceae bacterium]
MSSERQKEIRRRRKRKAKYGLIKPKLAKMDSTAKEKLVGQLRKMTPGAEVLIKNWAIG